MYRTYTVILVVLLGLDWERDDGGGGLRRVLDFVVALVLLAAGVAPVLAPVLK